VAPAGTETSNLNVPAGSATANVWFGSCVSDHADCVAGTRPPTLAVSVPT
jgi:hypothetical protein